MATGSSLIPAASYRSRRAWLIGFGIVEIAIACFILLLLVIVVVAFRQAGIPNLPEQGSGSRTSVILMAGAFYGGLAATFLIVGVGSILCRNWARIAMLVVSTLWLITGLLSAVVILLVLPATIAQQSALPPEVRHRALIATVAILGLLMVVAPVVFLVFYSRNSVKDTCLARGALPTALRVPVVVIVLAVWQSLGVLAVFGFPLVNAAILFGRVLHGPAAFLLLLIFSVLSGYAAWAIYHQQLAGWTIALCSTLFWTASTIWTFARRDMLGISRDMGFADQQTEHLPAVPADAPHRLDHQPARDDGAARSSRVREKVLPASMTGNRPWVVIDQKAISVEPGEEHSMPRGVA